MSKGFWFAALCGEDGTEYHGHGVRGFFEDAFKAAAGFFIPVTIVCGIVQVGHWVGIW